MYFKNNQFKYCQAELGEGESTDFLITVELEDSSVETQDKSLRKAKGANKNFQDSTESLATMDLEDSSLETQGKNLKEAAGETKSLPEDLVEVHKKGKYVVEKDFI